MNRKSMLVAAMTAGAVVVTHRQELVEQYARNDLSESDPRVAVIDEASYAGNVTAAVIDSALPLPRKLSNRPDHRDYHPSFMRVGLRVDGEERSDVNYYDMDSMTYETQTRKGLRATSIEPYWRYPETRQQRRARTRWEASKKR